jgi:hypothetical protein
MHPSSGGAGKRWRGLVVAAVSVAVLTTLTGCRIGEDPPPDSAEAPGSGVPDGGRVTSPSPARETDASTGLFVYDGPPDDAPSSSGPVTTLEAAVDLTPAAPGIFSSVEYAVAAPDGSVHVALTPVNDPRPPRLGTVQRTGAGYAVTGSVPMSGVDDLWGMHLLADGTVAVTGSLRTPDGRRAGYGAALVDPAKGTLRTTVVEPVTGKIRFAFGRSALNPDGRTLYMFVSTNGRAGWRERLVTIDLPTGEVVDERDLTADVAEASDSPAGHEVAGMVALPHGGVTLVLDASPDASRPGRIPTLLTYTPWLDRVGDPVRVTSLAEQAEIQAVAGGIDGTTFLVVQVRDGAWVLAVPPGGGAGPVLAQLDDNSYDYALAVEPAQVWGLVPAREGARPVDLTTGEVRPAVDVGCPGRDVRGIFPGPKGVSALVIGECNAPRTRTQMLWILGP